MSGIGNILGGGGIMSLAAETAMAVETGGTSLVLQAALKGVGLAIGDNFLQAAGQQLGLPQSTIELAQAAFHGAAGDPGGAVQSIEAAAQSLSAETGSGDYETGQVQQQSYDAVSSLLNQFNEQLQQGKDADGNNATAAAGGKGQSFLVALAVAMGKATDDKMDQMLSLAKNIDQANSSGDKSNITEMSGEMQAMSQEVSMLSTAMSTSIKAIGEASSSLARKD